MSGADEGQRATGDKWGDEISDEREAWLEQRLQAWEQEADHGNRRGPFDGVKLTGADVFWLAARTLAGTDEAQAVAEQTTRLRHAPNDWSLRSELQLSELHLERALLDKAHLENASLYEAHLEDASLDEAHLEGADLRWAHLERAFLARAHLEGSVLVGAHLERAFLGRAHLEGADLTEARLVDTDLSEAHLEDASLSGAHLEDADLSEAHLEGRTYVPDDVDYQRVRRSVLDFPLALSPAYLCGAFFNSATTLTDITLGTPDHRPWQGYAQVADVRWGGVNLAVVKDWPAKMVLGDERVARTWQSPKRKSEKRAPATKRKEGEKPRQQESDGVRHQREQASQNQVAEAAQLRLELFRAAVRANRQVATALREQGMNEEADRFAYRAQVCQRRLFSLQRQWGRWFLQTLLAVLAGYGFRLGRIFTAYVAVLLAFATIYFLIGLPNTGGGFTLDALRDAFLVSLTAIHGRVFLEQLGQYSLQAWVAAIESVTGIVIEGVFVAMLAQRFFGGR